MQVARSFVGAAAVLFVATVASAFTRPPAATARMHDELISLASMACNSSCKQCLITSEHKNEAGGTTHGLGQHACFEVALQCEYHTCTVSAAPPKLDLERMVADSRLEDLIESVPRKNLEFVPERGVVQLLADCGTVIAQLPATAAASVLLSSE